jgi:hypothetical protein
MSKDLYLEAFDNEKVLPGLVRFVVVERHVTQSNKSDCRETTTRNAVET